MTINLQLPQKPHLKPSITVCGVGGAGGNAVNNMIEESLGGVNFIIANTDAQAIESSKAEHVIQLGESITQGLGAGSYPEVGKASAEEAAEEIVDHLQGSHMVFITAGMGGGTGTGAAPVVAKLAREQGILTVAVVTKPFHFEGAHRMRVAELGLQELQKYVDTLIIIPNQNLFRIADKSTTFVDAFKLADEVLHSGVRGITDLMVMPGLINLDFADIRSVMSEMGKAMMGTGEASGDNRAVEAAEAAISNPLLDNVSMKGAKGVLINISGGNDMTLFEVDEAANRIREEVDPDANIIFGSAYNKDLESVVRVSVVATGIDSETDARDVKHIYTAAAPREEPEKKSEQSSFDMDEKAGESTSSAEESLPGLPGIRKKQVEEDDSSQDDDEPFIAPEPVELKKEPEVNEDAEEEVEINEPRSTRLFGLLGARVDKKEAVEAEEPQEVSLDKLLAVRKAKESAGASEKNAPMSKEDELEIPAFLRRKS